ncbi:MAG: hypothetical protein COW65_14475 [Cytophagales bacterium CG18_big_fil_WC_8_21_14_2_50_42_9]|nr:MAG: hypothetical protein COW65_14475 [Cytophagales bacterium CG18_big_fil_WC_8_21_14_2_50_42_9]
MKRMILLILFMIGFYATGSAQVRYSGKIESAYLKFQNTTIDVEPGPNWRGYYLNGEQNGIDINLINGISFKDKLFAGIGVGYLNFEGIKGISVFSDFGFIPLKKRIAPMLNAKLGYSHIWNQYKNGTGSALIELGAGLRFGITERMGVYVQSGILMTQQSAMTPIRIGIDF